MSAAGKALEYGGDLMIVCLIVTVGIICGRMSVKTSQASTAVINQNTIEYLEADISSLLSGTFTGSTVKQYIDKYRRSMGIEIITLKSFTARQDAMQIDAKTSLQDIKDKDNLFYVDNRAIYFCEADKDSNGNYKTLRFIQNGVLKDVVPDEVVTNADEAKTHLITILGGNPRMSWDEIVRAAQYNSEATADAKINLVNELNKYTVNDTVSTDSQWNEITDTVSSVLSSYKDSLDGSVNSARHNREAFSLVGGDSKELNFTPTVVIVVDNATREKAVWSSDISAGWLIGSPSIGISGKIITNNAEGGSVSVICYN